MNLVRRSISFPEDIYETLRLEAFARRVSVNQLVTEKIRPNKKKLSIDEQLKKDFAFFDKIGRSGLAIDAVAAVREDRDRDDA